MLEKIAGIIEDKLGLDAKKEDVIIVKSPLGMPARALNNDFMKRANKG